MVIRSKAEIRPSCESVMDKHFVHICKLGPKLKEISISLIIYVVTMLLGDGSFVRKMFVGRSSSAESVEP